MRTIEKMPKSDKKLSNNLLQTFKFDLLFDLNWPSLTFDFFNLLDRILPPETDQSLGQYLFLFKHFFSQNNFNFYWHSIVNFTHIILSNSLEITISAAKNGISSQKNEKSDSKIFLVKLFCFIWHLNLLNSRWKNAYFIYLRLLSREKSTKKLKIIIFTAWFQSKSCKSQPNPDPL